MTGSAALLLLLRWLLRRQTEFVAKNDLHDSRDRGRGQKIMLKNIPSLSERGISFPSTPCKCLLKKERFCANCNADYSDPKEVPPAASTVISLS
jgi:hypothetical protein